MKTIQRWIRVVVIGLLLVGCSGNDQDDNLVSQNPNNGQNSDAVKNFVWKGLNLFYLYQAEVPNLADTRFSSQTELDVFLNTFSKPDELFESLIYQRQTVDRFSIIVEDFIALEQSFQGISKSNGMDFRLSFLPNSDTNLFGFVRFVLPGSPADLNGIKRGDFFTEVNGTSLTVDNFSNLLFGGDVIVLTMADFVQGNPPSFVNNGITKTLTATTLTENPIFINKTFDFSGHKIGYLMYNGFTSNFDTQLNDVFGTFKSAGITDLVLDLRYNPGGSVATARNLGSMITGQFTGQVFSKQIWNAKIQEIISQDDPDALNDNFVNSFNGNAVNSLNLSRVYVITTGSSASASELLVNSLSPYIDVIQIGTKTTGKFQASITLYDSPDFGRQGANPNHAYAMQPLVLKLANRDGVTDFSDGLTPDIVQREFVNDLGILGDPSEPLLAIALNQITGSAPAARANNLNSFDSFNWNFFKDSNDFSPLKKEMYLENFKLNLPAQK